MATRTILVKIQKAAMGAALVAFMVPQVQAQDPIVQTFYTPIKEAQLLPILNQTSGNGAPVSPMHTVLSMVATRDDTVIYYDHWEDGFEADLINPVQSTTLVLGDSDLSNGCAGDYFPTPLACSTAADDVINAGDILNNREDNIVIPRDPASVLLDGGDKIGASRTIAMTRSSWASGSNTLMGDSTEIYDTTYYGTSFTFPVGENPDDAVPPQTANPPYTLFSNELFENTVPMVMASEDNTTISLDYNGDGTIDANTTLDEGQAFSAPLTANIYAGGTVSADKPVQVQLMTGNDGANYAFDGFTLFPTERWTDDYYTPVSRTCDSTTASTGPEDSHVWLHNPNATAITVYYEDSTTITPGSFTIQPGQTVPYQTVNSSGNNPSGSHFYTTDGSVFGAVGTMDSDLGSDPSTGTPYSNSAWDWGYTLIPEGSLSTEVIVGWGPGRDPTSATNPNENGNPVWVTVADNSAGTKRVYVDFDGDPGTGSLTDPNGDQYDVHYDLATLQSQTVYDTINADQDQTGTRVYTTDGTRIAVAWGQDVCTASAGEPGLDVGTAVLPLASLDFSKTATLAPGGDVNGNGLVDFGDTLKYTLSIFNVSNVTASSIVLEDTMDANTTYVANSTVKDGTTPVADAGTTPFPLDEGGITVGTLSPNGSTEYTFLATVNSPLPDGVESVTNSAVVSSNLGTVPVRVTTPVRIPAFEVTKVSNPENFPVRPGDTIDYTIEVTNTSDTTQTGVTVTDPQPPGTSPVPGSTVISAPSQPIRATEYYIGGGDGFDGTTYDLVLDRDLADDYFVIIQGSSTLSDSGPRSNYVRVTQDPDGTGDLDTSVANNVIRLERSFAASTWIGVVTVVESVTDQATEGFTLLDVQSVAHTGTATSGTDTSGSAWSDVNDVVLFGGFNGAGCTTDDPDPDDIGNCQTRLYPSGTNTINWTRDPDNVNDVLTDATSTVMVVEWGSSWTVQHRYVTGSNGGDKVDELNEYDTAAITPVARDNTWVWGTGTTTGTNQLKRNPEGIVITLGDGVNQNATESTVAVGSYNGIQRDFDVYVMTHPDLVVDYRFKPDGDKDFATVDVTVDSTGANRMAVAYTGNNAGNDNTPAHMFSARFTSDTNVRLEQQRTEEDWAAWVQAIGFSAIEGPTTGIPGGNPPTLASGYILEPGQSMTITFQVTVNASPGVDEIVNTVGVTSDQDPGPNEATVTDPLGSLIGDYIWYDLDGQGDQDTGEPGIAGVTVYLRDSGGTIIDTAVTDANGFYQFILGTGTGNFTVDVDETTLPGGLTPTYEKDGTPYDSQVLVNIPSVGTVIDDIDFGYQPTGYISGTIYDDIGADNDQDAGDPGLENVQVGLYYSDGVTPVLDSDGNPLISTTNANGFYEFENLPGDNYVIVVDPGGTTLPTNSINLEEPDDPVGGDDSRAAVTLAAGGSLTEQDFGYNVPDYLGKTVDKATAEPGEVLTYTLTPYYQGSDLLTNARVSDTIPAGTTYVGDSDLPEATLSEPTGGGTGLISWDLGDNTLPDDGEATGSILCPAYLNLPVVQDVTNENDGAFEDSGDIKIKRASGAVDKVGLVQFDVSSIPPNAIITSASFGIELNTAKNQTHEVFRLLKSWNETASSAANWLTLPVPGTDYVNNAIDNSINASSTGWKTVQGTELTALVDDWRFDAAVNNYGLAIIATSGDDAEAKYDSGSAKLLVKYSIPSTVACSPTPAVLDQFTDATYRNQDGNAPWVGDWIESDDKETVQNAGGGDISVVDGTGPDGYLKFKHEQDDTADNNQWIYREADLSGPVTAATFSYTLLVNGQDAGETVEIQASNDGGDNWVFLQEIDLNTSSEDDAIGTGEYSFDLLDKLGSVSNETRVRIVQTAANSDGKDLEFDDMNIEWTLSPAGAYSANLSASPTLARNGDLVTITMTVTSPGALNNITPTDPVLKNISLGAGCSSITDLDTSVKSIGSGGGTAEFSWTCTAVSGTGLPASVDFESGSVSATGTDGNAQTVNVSAALSNSVLLPPPLQFQVTVGASGLPNEILNRGYLQDDVTITNPVPSNQVDTNVVGRISGTVENDLDGDGNFGDTDTPIEGVTITLSGTDFEGNTYNLTTTTAPDGTYEFTGLPAGTYTVTETDLTGYVSTNDTDDGTAPDADNTIGVTLGAGEFSTDNDYLDTIPADISGTVREDTNGDTTGDFPLAGVTVTLTGTDNLGNAVNLTTTTAADGSYIFENVMPGDYTVTETDPAGYTSVADTFGLNDNLITVTLTSGVDSTGNDYVDRQTPGSIGDYVWLDENGDGVQDAGEAGIANVKVTLIGTDDLGNSVSLTTYTDANGGYLFDDLRAGSYTVTVDTASMPTGLGANPTYDKDSGTTSPDASTAVTLAASGEVSDADFGFNWVPPTDTLTPAAGATGAIGDSIWIDSNGDGIRDPGEAGLGGVTVTIYHDPDGDGVYNTPYTDGGYTATTTTAADGSYIFDGLPAGSYVVEATPPTGFSQTGDPDGTLDNATTSPIVLAPGDVYVNADFAYQPDTGAGNSIGDSVWLDADGNGVVSPYEPGIPGVVVELTWYGPDNDPGGTDNIVYTAVTDENGNYLFENLPDGDFDVEIVASNFVQGGALYDSENPTYDADGTGTPNVSVISGLGVGSDAGVADLEQDFGYSPSDGTGAEGVIGDTIFFDANGNGLPDPGEGMPGVIVELYADGDTPGVDTPIATTTTDADGNYLFGDLPAATYIVAVDTDSLPPSLSGTDNTIDPDGSTANQSTVTLAADTSVNLTQDFGYTGTNPLTNSIGDTIWLDADGSGTQIDEPGIPGVLVQLTYYGDDGQPGNGDDVIFYAVTDENGQYLFDNLPEGNYSVTTDLPQNTGVGGPLEGLFAGYDLDGGDDSTTAVSITGNGNVVDNIDMAYTPSNGTGDEGVIGDVIFLDLNGNGLPDEGEGIAGVVVDLYDGATFVGSTTTDADGRYYFGDLAAGTYTVDVDETTLPAGVTNTTDPDGGVANQSTVTLATNTDVNLDQDFGYQQNTTGTIGDQVWLDANRDGNVDAGEPGIAGVTVSLIQDTNGNGVWDAGEPIIATDITDDDGQYSFSGLPLDDGGGDADADYLVWVNDADNVLGNLQPVADDDGTAPATGVETGYGISAVELSSTTPTDYDQDFAYAPSGHDSGEGLIGNTVFIDYDGDGQIDPNEGVEGVIVELYDATGTTLLATTTTDENGNYYFGGLDATETYTVEVDSTTLPNNGTDLSNTVDPDAIKDGVTVVDLNAAGGTSLGNDFGYVASNPNTISGTIWNDANGDGFLDENAAGLAGVTVDLYDSDGNLVATTTTDAQGNYSFPGLPDGTYTVDVTDTGGVLDGTWHSIGPDAGDGTTDNNSQVDGYVVSVSNGDNDVTADFGYYSEPTAIEGIVFFDRGNANANGIYGDENDTVFAGIEVTLTIVYPNGDTVVVTTLTDQSGTYRFDNLLLDENFDGDDGTANGSDSGFEGIEPSFTVSLNMNQEIPGPLEGTLADYYATSQTGSQQTADSAEQRDSGVVGDADQVSGTMAMPETGYVDITNDFGLRANSGTTRVSIDQFEAVTMNAVEVISQMASDSDSALAMLAKWSPGLAESLTGAPYETIVDELLWAMDADGDGAVALLTWQTLEERGTMGFYAERRQNGSGWVRVNSGDMLPGLIVAPLGGEYLLIDIDARVGEEYSYRVVEAEVWGGERNYGPWRITIPDVAASGSVDLSSSIVHTDAGDREFENWINLDRGFSGRARKVKEPKIKDQATANKPVDLPNEEIVGLRFLTTEEGLTAVELGDMGAIDTGKGNNTLDKRLERGEFVLTSGGVAVPYFYDKKSEALYFAAETIRTRDTVTNVYNLVEGPGLLAEDAGNKAPKNTGVPGVFTDSIRVEENNLFAAVFMTDADADTGFLSFVWAPFIPTTDVMVDLPDVAATGTVTVRVGLRGALDEGPGNDHRSSLEVNGTPVGSPEDYDGFEPATLEATFDQSLLASSGPGTTSATFTVVQEGLVARSLVLVEYVEVEYQREMHALADELWLHDVSGPVTVDGFTTDELLVIESPSGDMPKIRQDVLIDEVVNGQWSVTFEAAETGDFLVSATSQNSVVETNYASDLLESGEGAEYLVIAPDELLDGAQALADYRQNRFDSAVVRLQDIYDRYSYGRADSVAIEQFLAELHANWIQVPSHVVLLGRGTQDHTDALGYGESLLPIRMVSTPKGLAGSDYRYADVDGDRIPDFSLGRISVSDEESLLAYLAKLEAFENEAWAPGSLSAVVSDNSDSAGNFLANSELISEKIDLLGFAPEEIYNGEVDVRTELQSGWANGRYMFVNYDGHGGKAEWGNINENFLLSSDVENLLNLPEAGSPALPIVAALTCSVGDSTEPGVLGLMDSLVTSEAGGAIAAFAPSGESLDNFAHILNTWFIEYLFGSGDDIGTAGRKSVESAVLSPNPDTGEIPDWMIGIYQVEGDPAIRLQQ